MKTYRALVLILSLIFLSFAPQNLWAMYSYGSGQYGAQQGCLMEESFIQPSIYSEVDALKEMKILADAHLRKLQMEQAKIKTKSFKRCSGVLKQVIDGVQNDDHAAHYESLLLGNATDSGKNCTPYRQGNPKKQTSFSVVQQISPPTSSPYQYKYSLNELADPSGNRNIASDESSAQNIYVPFIAQEKSHYCELKEVAQDNNIYLDFDTFENENRDSLISSKACLSPLVLRDLASASQPCLVISTSANNRKHSRVPAAANCDCKAYSFGSSTLQLPTDLVESLKSINGASDGAQLEKYQAVDKFIKEERLNNFHDLKTYIKHCNDKNELDDLYTKFEASLGIQVMPAPVVSINTAVGSSVPASTYVPPNTGGGSYTSETSGGVSYSGGGDYHQATTYSATTSAPQYQQPGYGVQAAPQLSQSEAGCYPHQSGQRLKTSICSEYKGSDNRVSRACVQCLRSKKFLSGMKRLYRSEYFGDLNWSYDDDDDSEEVEPKNLREEIAEAKAISETMNAQIKIVEDRIKEGETEVTGAAFLEGLEGPFSKKLKARYAQIEEDIEKKTSKGKSKYRKARRGQIATGVISGIISAAPSLYGLYKCNRNQRKQMRIARDIQNGINQTSQTIAGLNTAAGFPDNPNGGNVIVQGGGSSECLPFGINAGFGALSGARSGGLFGCSGGGVHGGFGSGQINANHLSQPGYGTSGYPIQGATSGSVQIGGAFGYPQDVIYQASPYYPSSSSVAINGGASAGSSVYNPNYAAYGYGSNGAPYGSGAQFQVNAGFGGGGGNAYAGSYNNGRSNGSSYGANGGFSVQASAAIQGGGANYNQQYGAGGSAYGNGSSVFRSGVNGTGGFYTGASAAAYGQSSVNANILAYNQAQAAQQATILRQGAYNEYQKSLAAIPSMIQTRPSIPGVVSSLNGLGATPSYQSATLQNTTQPVPPQSGATTFGTPAGATSGSQSGYGTPTNYF